MDVGFVDYVGFVDPTALTCPRCHRVSRKDPTIYVYSWMGRCPFCGVSMGGYVDIRRKTLWERIKEFVMGLIARFRGNEGVA